MQVFLIITAILAVIAVQPGCSKIQIRRDYHNVLSRLFGRTLDHQRRQVASGNCKQLSAAAAELVAGLKLVLEHSFNTIEYEVDIDKTFDSSLDMYMGFDFLGDTEARDAMHCAIQSANSVAELKEILDNLDLNYRIFQALYDVQAAFCYYGLDGAPESVQSRLQLVNNMGVLTIDQEGTNAMGELMMMAQVLLSVRPSDETFEDIVSRQPLIMASNDDLEAKCYVLQGIVSKAVRNKHQFYLVTGVDLSDEEQSERLVCNLLGKAPEGLRSMYEVIDNEGIALKMYEFIYPLIQQYTRMYTSHLQMMVMMSNTDGANGLQDDPVGGAGQVGPGGFDKSFFLLVLEYLEQLEASGFLSLQ